MLNYLLQVLEAALAAAILLGCVFAAGGEKKMALPCLTGTAAAFVLAVLRRTTAINMGRVITFAAILCFAAGAVFLIKKQRIIQGALAALLLFCYLPAVFLFPTEFLLAGERAFSTDFLFKWIGYAAGLAFILCTALAVYKTAVSVDGQYHKNKKNHERHERHERHEKEKDTKIRSSLCVTSCPQTIGLMRPLWLILLINTAFIINMLHQACTILQFLFARRMIPMNRALFRLITPALNHSIFFLFAIITVTVILPVSVFLKNTRPPIDRAANPAERRKTRKAAMTRRGYCLRTAVLLVSAVLLLGAVKPYTERGVQLTPAEPMHIQAGEIVIPLETIEDGRLHRYNYNAQDGIEMRFIIIKKNEAAYGVGLDACDICGPTGYYERKNEVICRLCDVVMNKATIGFRGGCNPVPLAYVLRGGNLILETENLENERNRFK
ncbi:membrane protein [Spirochaetia bacterium]|nr:membrane protein [Spirochaetia bacterium]